MAIKLFQLGGVPARRIYLYGKKWQHVVIEYKMKDNLYLFDGHYDPETVLEDKDIGVILSEDISAYPNGYVENMYIDFCRIKIFYNFSPLRSISKMKLPTFIAYFFESPYLIKAFLALFFIMGICSYII